MNTIVIEMKLIPDANEKRRSILEIYPLSQLPVKLLRHHHFVSSRKQLKQFN